MAVTKTVSSVHITQSTIVTSPAAYDLVASFIQRFTLLPIKCDVSVLDHLNM